MMGRRLVVSDIHGEGHRLVKVLDKAGYEPKTDRLFLLGDYIDRGTDAKRTVELVQALVRDGAVALKGNHDAMPSQAIGNPAAVALWCCLNGGEETIASYGGFPPEEVLQWLESLPLYHEEPDCLLVHAGILPGVPLEQQKPNDLLWIREEFYHNYRGEKLIIFGHTPTPYLHGEIRWEPWFGPNMIGIDTGAAYGGVLTLMDIDTRQIWTA